MKLTPNKTIKNRYKIIGQLAENNVYCHYKAFDEKEKIFVIIKLLQEHVLQRSLEVLLRFRKVSEVIATLHHSNIERIYEIDQKEQNVIIQEDSSGKSLKEYLRTVNQPLTPQQATSIILQISSGLSVVHQQGILHQGINADTILLSEDNTQLTAKLTNFGTNLLLDLTKISEGEEVRQVFGYMSPEATGIIKKPLDERSDIYSLGILFYELLTGRLPYEAKDVATLIHQHVAQEPSPPTKVNTLIPPILEKIILRLIAKDPQDRYQSAAGLIADLSEYQAQKQQGKTENEISFEIARSDRLRELNFSTKLIGREKELRELQGYIDQTKDSQGKLCFVYGLAGIGKSRLVDELRSYVSTHNGIFIGGKCHQFEFRVPYKVFSEAIEAYCEKIKRLTKIEQDKHISRIKNAVGELGAEVAKIVPAISDLIGESPKLVPLEQDKERIRFLITVTNFILALASPETPVLLFLDDVQWVDDGSLEILASIAEKISTHPLVLISCIRDNEIDSHHQLVSVFKNFKEQNIPLVNIFLTPFDPRDSAKLIAQIIMEKEENVLPLAEELNQRAKGNPFFLLELLRSLIEEKIIFLQENHYTFKIEEVKRVSLPSNVVEIVLKRIENVPSDDLQIFSCAAVMGKEVQFEFLCELLEKPADVVLNTLERGIKEQFVVRDLTGKENIYFMHDRLREAFYKKVPETERIPIHRKLAYMLEEQNQHNLDVIVYDLAYHFSHGKVDDKALLYSVKAADKAKSSYAHIQAIDLYRTAKEILEGQNKTESDLYIDVLENLGETYRLAGKFDESLEVLKICQTLIPEKEKLRQVRILSLTGDTLWEQGNTEQNALVLEEALRLLGEKIPRSKFGVYLFIFRELFIQAWHSLLPKIFVKKSLEVDKINSLTFQIFNTLGHNYFLTYIQKAFYLLVRSLNRSEKSGSSQDLAYCYIYDAPVLAVFPWFSRGYSDLEKGLKLSQELGDKLRECIAYAYYCLILYFDNRAVEGEEYGLKSIEKLKKLGVYFELGTAYVYTICNYIIQGKFKEADRLASEFEAVMKMSKAYTTLSWAYMVQTLTHCHIGDVDQKIIQNIEKTKELEQKIGNKSNIAGCWSYLALAHARRKEYSQAIVAIEESVKALPEFLGPWVADIFPIGAQVYLGAIVDNPGLSGKAKKEYLQRAKWFCRKAFSWGRKFKGFLGMAYQVNGTYYWLQGKKKKAFIIWEEGITFLRAHSKDKYRLGCVLLEQSFFLLKDNPKDVNVCQYLLEAKDLFIQCGCTLDLELTNKLLESITSGANLSLDSRQVLTQKRHLDSLLSVNQAIGSIFVLEDLLKEIMEYALRVTGAERGFLFLFDQIENNLKLKVSHTKESEGSKGAFSYDDYRISLELVKEVEKIQEAIIAGPREEEKEKISQELRTYEVKQAAAIPLKTKGKFLGILYLDNLLAGGMFGVGELELLKSFAVQASISIENAQLVNSMVEQARLKQELELGKRIQMHLLPKESPRVDGLSLTGIMIPAREIGGDYYDYIVSAAPAVKLGVVIGDVSGKGVAAGLVMAMAKTAIWTIAQDEVTPKQMLLKLNQTLYQHIKGERFMSCLYMQWDSEQRKLNYSSAGHEHILIYRGKGSKVQLGSSAGTVESVKSGGIVIGVVPEIEGYLENSSISLAQGDKVILYTDGVIDAHNEKHERYTLQKLTEAVKKYGHKSPQELINSLKDEVYHFMGEGEQYDDITLLVMEAVSPEAEGIH